MKKNRVEKICTATALAIGVLSAPCAVADFELSVKIPTITEVSPKQQVDVLSWSWALSESSAKLKDQSLLSACGDEDFFFIKPIDQSSGGIIMATALRTLLPSAELAVREVDGQGVLIRELTINMLNVVISSYKTGSSGSEDGPTEEVTLNYGSFEGEYTEQDSNGGEVTMNFSGDKSDCK
jgi:type VI protein secretion system component Hcp